MNVLVAIDGSKYGRWALNWVAQLPFSDPPRVSALHVCDHAALRAPFMAQPVIPGIELIEQNVLKLVEAGFTAEPACRVGKPADKIMKLASKQHVDLIVMGAQGLGAISRFLIGSVSTRVVQHANCAVLVVR